MHVIVALVRENQRDVGLVRAVGPWAFAASIVSMIVGAGIFAVPAALAACVGPYAPLAFLACGFAIGAVAICFAEGGSRAPHQRWSVRCYRSRLWASGRLCLRDSALGLLCARLRRRGRRSGGRDSHFVPAVPHRTSTWCGHCW